MPMYEYHCDKCGREVTLTLSITEHNKGDIKCPKCDGKDRKSTRLNSSHSGESRMPSSA